MSRLGRRYARALFEAAEEKGAIDAVAADLEKVKQALGVEGVRDVILDPQISRTQRGALVEKIVEGGHELSLNLVGVLLRRRREAVLPELHEEFGAMLREARGEVEGVVESAKLLDVKKLEELEAAVSASIGAEVYLEMRMNPDLIGGVRVRVGNTLYDGSVATALEELERRLSEVPIP